MFETAVTLDSKRHAGHGCRPVADYGFARNVLSAPLAGAEVVRASREFPIVFPETGRMVPVALMGYAAHGNLWVDENGNWTGRYIPAHLRRYPFVLGEQSEAGRFVVMVEPGALAEDGTGEVLFEDGQVPSGGIGDRARDNVSTRTE